MQRLEKRLDGFKAMAFEDVVVLAALAAAVVLIFPKLLEREGKLSATSEGELPRF